jgi:fibronectin type 3 domain-containing protein
MKKILAALAMLFAFSSIGFSQTAPKATVTWNAVTTSTNGTTITGVTYNVYRGVQANGSDGVKLNGSPITVLTYVDNTIDSTTVYYYAVSALSSTAVEGTKSVPVRFTFGDIQPATPGGVSVH